MRIVTHVNQQHETLTQQQDGKLIGDTARMEVDLAKATKEGEPPPGCSLRPVLGNLGASPSWCGMLPAGQKWKGKNSMARSFQPGTVGSGPLAEVGSCPQANKAGQAVVMSEPLAKMTVLAFLWDWWHQSHEAASSSSAAASSSLSAAASSSSTKQPRETQLHEQSSAAVVRRCRSSQG